MKGDGIDKNGLIAPPRGAVPLAGAGGKAARAWQLEMERAQMQAWFSHSLLTLASSARPEVCAPREIVAAAAGATAASQPAALGVFADAHTHPHITTANAMRQDEPLIPANEYEDGEFKRDPDHEVYSLGASPTRGLERQSQPDRSLLEWSRHAAPAEPRDLARPSTQQSPFSRIPAQRLESSLRDLTAEVGTAFAGHGPHPTQAGEGFVSSFVEAAPRQRTDSSSKASVEVVSTIPVTPESPATPLKTGASRESLPAQPQIAFSLERSTTLITGNAARPVMAAPCGQEAALREPIRLHADWSSDGVRLWLGLDASLAAALPTIAAQLQRWLSAQGVRLLSMSCNGRPVDDPDQAAAADRFEDHDTPYAATLSVARPILKETP